MRIIERIAALFAGLASAGAVSAAVEAGRRPADADLRALGIDPRAFAAIGRG
jgi:hypothetical protein